MSEIELSGVETSVSNDQAVVENPTENALQQPETTDVVTPAPVEAVVEVATTVTAVAEEARSATEEAGASEVPPVLDLNEEKLKEAVRGFLKVEVADFTDLVDKCSVQELALLMEELSTINLSRDNIRKVGKLKTRFDALKESHYKDLKAADPEEASTKELKELVDTTSKRFTAALAKFNQRKAEFEQNEQKSREENTVKKRALLDKLMEIVQKDDFTAIEDVRNIQEEWKNTGPVVQAETETLFQTYRTYTDQFYAQRQRYLDLLEQSRNVNLEEKRKLVKEAQNLIPEDLSNVSRNFWQETSDRLKLLHEQWRGIGPVPKKDSDEVWNLFKEASDTFYSAKRAYFQELDEARSQNATQKREILDRLAEISVAEYDSIDGWRSSTDEVKGLRENWKKIGPAPSSENEEINNLFSEHINRYFDRRTAFFNELDKNNEDVLKKKEELLERAEALKDSDDWKKTTDELVKLQKEWNDAGDDSFKDARKLRKRFRKACDTFFKRKKDHVSTIQQGETENLAQKEALRDKLIEAAAKIQADPAWATSEEGISAENIYDIREQFESIGRVPLSKKDSILKEFRNAFDDYLALLFPDAQERERFKIEHGGGGNNKSRFSGTTSPHKIEHEEKQIQKRIQSLKEKITQFENNFVFISQSKSSDVFRKEIEAKIAEARKELESVEKRREALKDLKRTERERQNAEKNAQKAQSQEAEAVTSTDSSSDNNETGDTSSAEE